VVSRIEERIAAWTFLPEGEMKPEHSHCLLQFSSVQFSSVQFSSVQFRTSGRMCVQVEIFEFDV
jgi:hypothetical protein